METGLLIFLGTTGFAMIVYVIVGIHHGRQQSRRHIATMVAQGQVIGALQQLHALLVAQELRRLQIRAREAHARLHGAEDEIDVGRVLDAKEAERRAATKPAPSDGPSPATSSRSSAAAPAGEP